MKLILRLRILQIIFGAIILIYGSLLIIVPVLHDALRDDWRDDLQVPF